MLTIFIIPIAIFAAAVVSFLIMSAADGKWQSETSRLQREITSLTSCAEKNREAIRNYMKSTEMLNVSLNDAIADNERLMGLIENLWREAAGKECSTRELTK